MNKPAPFRIEWDAHEYEHKERSQDWFWAVGIISVATAAASAIFGNIIFGLFILTAVFALAVFINRPPETIHVVVSEKGITRDKIHYPYGALRSFFIDTDHPHPKILLGSEKVFVPLIVVPLGEGVDTEELRDVLDGFLKEEYHSLPLIERVIEYLGF